MKYDAAIVGSGPNGLAAGIVLASAGLSVVIYEARDTAGGGMRSALLTDPGFVHDICSAIHPLAMASPFFSSLPLQEFGLRWINPPLAVAHPLDDEPPIVLSQSLDRTLSSLGKDAKIYSKLMQPLIRNWKRILPDVLSPLKFPGHPLLFLGFALYAIQSAAGFTFRNFREKRTKALFAGLAAHSMLPLEKRFTAGVGLVLSLLGHTVGWPFPQGGSQKLTDALVVYFQTMGGCIETSRLIENLNQIKPSHALLFDTSPRNLLQIAGNHFPSSYRSAIGKYRYGSGVFKVDWALKGPIPFTASDCNEAGTLHIGGSMEEIAEAEEAVWRGEHPEKPFVIMAQQTRFDETRAPIGKQTAWAYCHVPSGSEFDMRERIEAQIERFAPGFRDLVIKHHCMNSRDMERYNPNYIGGDINGGVQDWRQLFTRPVTRFNPYTTPDPGIFLCSSSTPPGGGVHGMCGYYAARTVIKRIFKDIKHAA